MGIVDTTIWWQVYPLGATGAPIRDGATGDPEPPGAPVHRLRRLEGWLDYAAELGCTGLLLGPIFASTSHGYDTLDHFRIDPRLGDDHDVERLLTAATNRGLAVMLDGVFNHVGRAHPLVREALAAGRLGSGPALIRTELTDGVLVPRGWEGHDDLVELNHDHPQVADLVTEVMLHWLRRGIAGWRLDVAYAVAPAFWREVLARVRAEFPQALFLGEVIHGDYAAIAAEATLDSVTQYELWKGIWSSVADRNLWELAWALDRHDQFSQELVTQTFVGNHDVDRIASLLGDTGAVLALVVLMTVPGMPSLYYGDEQAFRGLKGDGPTADDPLRPPLPDRPEELAPHGWWLYRLHQQLIGLRRQNPWLIRARVHVVGKDNTWLTYESAAEGHLLRVHLDLVDGPSATVEVDHHPAFRWSATEL